MEPNQERARDLLPTIIITVLSMIQALALELYWTKIGESDFLWQGGWGAAIGWMQLLLMFLGMLLIWILYISVVLRFSWLPAMEDTLIPFFIGLLEFGMIDLMGPETLGPWFILLAVTFCISTLANHMVMRRARQDPANSYFFDGIEPANWRDYRITITASLTLAMFGLVLWVWSNSPVLSCLALLLALAALSRQILQSRKYWMHSLSAD